MTDTTYRVFIDGNEVWPETGSSAGEVLAEVTSRSDDWKYVCVVGPNNERAVADRTAA